MSALLKIFSYNGAELLISTTVEESECPLSVSLNGLNDADSNEILSYNDEYKFLGFASSASAEEVTYGVSSTIPFNSEGIDLYLCEDLTKVKFKYIKYNNRKIKVDSAIRDGDGKVISSNYVGLDNSQTITGNKNFKSEITFETRASDQGNTKLTIKNDNGYNAKIKMGSTENIRLMTGGTYFGTNIGSISDKSLDIGAPGYRWRDAYISRNILYPNPSYVSGGNQPQDLSIAVSNIESNSNKVSSLSAQSTDIQYPSAKAVYDAISGTIEIAEGKTATYVLSKITNTIFNSNEASITDQGVTVEESTEYSTITDINGTSISLSNLKIGDIILVLEVDVPDRWVSAKSNGTITFSKMETAKVDLTPYVTKAGTEEISGVKTFTNGIKIGNGTGEAQVKLDNSDRINLYFGNNVKVKVGSGDTLFDNRVSPDRSNTYDLGRSSVYWKDLYLAGNISYPNPAATDENNEPKDISIPVENIITKDYINSDNFYITKARIQVLFDELFNEGE